jgi:thiamine biosynthesis protein ThiS
MERGEREEDTHMRESVRVTLNGDEREVASGLTVQALLGDLGLHPGMVVVEHNRSILERARYGQTEVHEGDTIEVVHFVGGG